MSDFQEYKNEQLSDSEFAVEYEAMRLKYEVIRAVIDARLACNMTQKEFTTPSSTPNSFLNMIQHFTMKTRKPLKTLGF